MRAAYLTDHGGNEIVAVGERPRPQRQPGEVLVRLRAATVNRVDLYMRDSGAGITHTLPLIMGLDGAGVVEAIDAEERSLSVGQNVVLHPGIGCGRCEFCLRGRDTLCTSMRLLGEHRDGTFAEFVSLPARNVFAMPEGLSFGEAAALGVNHITAWSMLHGKAHIQPWESVLIFGVGGGVSLAALQLAKLAGARTFVTSRDPAKLERAQPLGADAVIDGRGDVVRQVMAATDGRGVDVAAAVLIGAGSTFIAGADIREFGQPAKDPSLPAVIAAIEACPKPVIAALHGSALGGGLEVALACDARIALAGTVLGLPEVTLGVVPGAGGTQRLPRRVGLVRGIELIGRGERIAADEAGKLRLLDAVVDGDLQTEAIALATRLDGRKCRIRDEAVSPADESAVEQTAQAVAKAGKRRPAVLAAIELARDAARLPFDEGLAKERACFLELRDSVEAAALRHQFFAEREATRLPREMKAAPRPVKTVAVIGAGTMGSGIAIAP